MELTPADKIRAYLDHRRAFFNDDPLYRIVEHLLEGCEVSTDNECVCEPAVKHAIEAAAKELGE